MWVGMRRFPSGDGEAGGVKILSVGLVLWGESSLLDHFTLDNTPVNQSPVLCNPLLMLILSDY